MKPKVTPVVNPAKVNERLFEKLTLDELEALEILIDEGISMWNNNTVGDPWYKDRPTELRMAMNVAATGKRLRRQVIRVIKRKMKA